ncbi:MAG TPA: hypothetical protein VFZ54_07350 [Burkholderiales bacterium]
MHRSTWLIIGGLVLSVAPVILNGVGTLMAKAYGRNAVAALLEWSILLLIISIPVGAAMVVAGGVAKFVDYRARRAAGITDRRI